MRKRILIAIWIGLVSMSVFLVEGEAIGLTIKSSAFKDQEVMASQYTCDGDGISPPLEWDDVPEGTASLALVCDDPDAPVGVWVHWVLYDIPPTAKSLQERQALDEVLADGSKQGRNDFGDIGYGGPCPPLGPAHRYRFTLYALDVKLEADPGLSKSKLLKAMEGHILAQTELIGRYQR